MGLIDWLRGQRQRGAPRLEPLMAALAADNRPEQRQRFFAAFRRSRLILPSPGLEATGLPMNAKVRTKESLSINLIGTEAPDGTRGVVAFTSEPALIAWRPVGCPYVEVPALGVVTMALSQVDAIVINPRGPTGGYISRAELVVLAEGGIPATLSAERRLPDEQIRLGTPPAPISKELIDLVKTAATELPAIRAAWILGLVIGSGEPHLAIVLEHAPGSHPNTFVPGLMTKVQTLLAQGEYVDCIPLLPGAALLQTARATAEPVFARG